MFSPTVQKLIDELSKLPGIGPKTAQRLTFHLLKLSPEDALPLAHALIEVKEVVRFCTKCGAEVGAGWKFCAKCKSSVSPPNAAPSENQ